MKDKIVAGLLALFLGTLGIHKFYLNETKPGVTYLVCYLAGLLTCWLLIDLIPMYVGNQYLGVDRWHQVICYG